ncbi:hypothetical protein CNAG_07550 [Cryptococcus neoformans var. grubii H99]|uniref:Metallo-beta-lactamase domain-containing protein n=1 Tax=Cryptococcus neoformans (strain H99 / ATCC 208821 / CBS 10515 / FGSC 9487) TaxID=235443 RepID=J9VQT2_CRYN9|nr:hypothetical protein CNAG_07550 [Cryptococcus neoformans var. grubii H99]AFR94060.2 hypothetical protein CNAG_07550 [Cryptococcus neoformans var. grubii H99]AUB23665.1 hypothetical protein CKF44_07550 [Cryptococcus neoformans var. grubii]|eukprot:XP_012047963.1 hypothetical protein CNAG_07550 [Cryptococcus neoformans var. grubii H99]
MAGIYNGHILEFPLIRVDSFVAPPAPHRPQWLIPGPSSSPSEPLELYQPPRAQLFLLSHTHADHVVGLTSDFTGHIICSPDTKRMLLDLEPERERQWLDKGIRETKIKRFGGLAAKRGIDGKLVDRIEALPYGQPKVFTLGYENAKPQEITITLLDANHCPGSTMFLITSDKKTVLHTGDVRADTRFIDSLKRNPILQEFLAPASVYQKAKSLVGGGRRVLDRIYLDTAAMLGTGDMPDKEPILQELVEIMGLYPEDTTFFLNTWCFGWEDVIKEVARYFNEKVHVDRYKSQIYSAIRSDPFLLNCTTTDPHETRFHACERFAKCIACRRFEDESGKPAYNLDKMIVHVNMVEVKQVGWDSRRQEFMEALFKAAKKGGPWPFNIDIPISRHSSLPELQSLVKLFKPLGLTPNTVASYAKGLDYYLLPDLFDDCLSPGAYERIVVERDHYLGQMYGKWYIEGLGKLRQQGFGVYPDIDKIEREDYYYKREDYLPEDMVADGFVSDEAQKVLGATRRDISMDQVSRLGGLPSLSPKEIYNRALRLMNQAVIDSPKPETMDSSDGWEYDTEEESMGRKKRRKRFASSPYESSQGMITEAEKQGEGVLCATHEGKKDGVDVKMFVDNIQAMPAPEVAIDRAQIQPTSPSNVQSHPPNPNPVKVKLEPVSFRAPLHALWPNLHHISGFSMSDKPSITASSSTKPPDGRNRGRIGPLYLFSSQSKTRGKRSMSKEELERMRKRLAEGGGPGLGKGLGRVKREDA